MLSKKMTAKHNTRADTTEAVDELMKSLDHPHKDAIVILHLGAKVRGLPAGGLAIKDPDKLLEWLAY